MSPQYGELGPLAAEIGPVVWGTPANFNGFCVLAAYCSDVAQRKPTKLCTVFGHYLGWYTTYTFSGVLTPLWNFARCKIHFPSLALSYFGSVTARHSSSRRPPNFAALSIGRHLYSAGRPSRWALAHILVNIEFCLFFG